MLQNTAKSLQDFSKGLSNLAKLSIRSRTEEELKKEYWLFKHKPELSKEQNLYNFWKCMELYKHFCMEWEVYHNGDYDIEKRVENKYLVEKIKEFAAIKSQDEERYEYLKNSDTIVVVRKADMFCGAKNMLGKRLDREIDGEMHNGLPNK